MEWRKAGIGSDFPLGQYVLIYDPEQGMMIAYFSSGHGWCANHTKARISPTHWAPLPPAPKT